MPNIPTFPFGAGPTGGRPRPPKPKPKPGSVPSLGGGPPPEFGPGDIVPPDTGNGGPSLEDLIKQAQAVAQASLDPYRAEIIRQQQQAWAQAQAQAQQQRDISAALAQALQQAGPAVQGIYQQAGADQSAFAKGFSDTMRQLAEGDVSKQNEFLGKIGAPPEQMLSAAPWDAAANVTYGLGGFIPAQTFSREGAAFGAAASLLPATTRMQGEREASGTLAQGQRADVDFNQQLLDLESKRPGMVQSALGDLQKQQFDYQKWVAEQKLRQAELVSTQDYRRAQLTKPQVIGSAAGGYYEWDPATGKVRQVVAAQAKPVRPQVFGSTASGYYAINPETGEVQQIVAGQPGAPKVKIVGSDKTGRYAYDPATGQRTLIVPPSKTTKPKVDAKTLNSATKFAVATAAEAYKGFWTEQTARAAFSRIYASEQEARKAVKPGGNVGYSVEVVKDGNVVGYDNWNPPINYQVALQEMLKMPEIAALPAGERLRVVQGALNRYYKRGERGRPQRAFQERQQAGGLPGGAEGTAPRAAPANAVAYAVKQIGQPYKWGGEDRAEGGFDCSGLIDWAYRKAGIDFPGRLTTYSAMKVGVEVPKGAPLQPGDLIITNDGEHMVMYVGNGQVIAASGGRKTGGRVVYQPADYHLARAVAIRRVVAPAVSAPAATRPPSSTPVGPEDNPAYVWDPQRKVWYNPDTGTTWTGAGAHTPPRR